MVKPKPIIIIAMIVLALGVGAILMAVQAFVEYEQTIDLAAFHRAKANLATRTGNAASLAMFNTYALEDERDAASVQLEGVAWAIGGAAILIPGLILARRANATRPFGALVAGRTFANGRPYSARPAQERRRERLSQGALVTKTRARLHSRNQASHRGRRSDVFVSYSRRDQAFVKHLVDRLAARGRQVWIDWREIPVTADWMQEIQHAIDAADTFLFVITPDSVMSKTCRAEFEYALSSDKRIVPVLHRDVQNEVIPFEVGALHWVQYRRKDDPNAAFAELTHAIELDLDWTRFHTRLLVRAKEWDENRRDASYLLNGVDLDNAQIRLANISAQQPRVHPLQKEYVLASQQWEAMRHRRQIRGFYLASIAYGSLQVFITYFLSFDEISETVLTILAPIWILAFAFGGSGLLMARPTLGKAAASAAAIAAIMVVLYQTVWPLL